MTELSPGAQAVLSACGCPDPSSPFFLVARGFASVAIRAAADLVEPVDIPEGHDCCLTIIEDVRAELLALAAELEGEV